MSEKAITIKLCRMGSDIQELEVKEGTTLGEVAAKHGSAGETAYSDDVSDPSAILLDGAVVIFARTIRGELPTPRLREVRRLLKSLGYIKTNGGKGDHEKWTKPDAPMIVLNPHKADRQYLDHNATRSLCQTLGMSWKDVLDAC